MKFINVLMTTAAISLAMPAVAQQTTSVSRDVQTQELDARYSEAERLRRAIGVDLDIKQAFEMHTELAEAGYGRSLHRLGDFHYNGILVPRSYRTAAAYYGQAVEAGNQTSLINQSRALRRANAGEAALAVIERAIVQQIDGAFEERASGHLFAEYGRLSNVGFGFTETERLASTGDNQVAAYQLGEAHRRGLGTPVNHNEAFRIFEVLTKEGHAAATERLGNYYATGVAVEKDADRAIELYRVAAGLGREGAYVPMSDLMSELGRGADALLAMQQGVDEGSSAAELNLAIGHLDGAFGADSDADLGRTELIRLAEGGDLRAAAMVLDRLGNRERLAPDLDLVVSHLDRAMQNGDGRAAETLLRFYREVPASYPDTRARRETILDTYAGIMRERIYYPELASFAYDTNRGVAAYPMLLEIVNEADGDGYERALLQIFRRDPNAFTYILQDELKNRGEYNGRLNGRMNEESLRATLRYCTAKDINDECIHGPLRTSAVRLIATALRRDKDVAAQGNG